MRKPNLMVILIDDLRYDEFGAGGHPYMKTPNIDRLAHEGAMFDARLPHHADLLAQPGLDRDRPVREPPRDHRQRRARRDEPPAAQLPPRAAAPGLRDGAHRQVAHGQRRQAAARLRLLGELRRPRQARSTRCSTTTGRYSGHKGYITDIMNDLAVDFLEAEAQQALLAVLRAQGRASGRRAGRRRHPHDLGAGRLHGGRAPPGPLQQCDLPEARPTCSPRPRW